MISNITVVLHTDEYFSRVIGKLIPILMKQIICIVLGASLLAFTSIRGGESYTIHLNNKLLVEHYLTSKAATPTFSLEQASENDQLSVYYNECGKIGKERKLSIQDVQGNVLKTWSFANALGEHIPMICKVKDIIALKKNDRSILRLYYSSTEVSAGRLLANVVANQSSAKK